MVRRNSTEGSFGGKTQASGQKVEGVRKPVPRKLEGGGERRRQLYLESSEVGARGTLRMLHVCFDLS